MSRFQSVSSKFGDELKASSTFVVANSNIDVTATTATAKKKNNNIQNQLDEPLPTPRLFVPKSTKRKSFPDTKELKTPSPSELPRYLSYMTPAPPSSSSSTILDIYTPEIDLPLDSTPPPPPEAPPLVMESKSDVYDDDDATVIERESIDTSRDSLDSRRKEEVEEEEEEQQQEGTKSHLQGTSFKNMNNTSSSHQIPEVDNNPEVDNDIMEDATTAVCEMSMMVSRLSSLTSKVAKATKDLDILPVHDHHHHCHQEKNLRAEYATFKIESEREIATLRELVKKNEMIYETSLNDLRRKLKEKQVCFENFESETKRRQCDEQRRERSMRHKIEDLRRELEERDRETAEMQNRMDRVEKERRELGLHRKSRDEQAKRERSLRYSLEELRSNVSLLKKGLSSKQSEMKT